MSPRRVSATFLLITSVLFVATSLWSQRTLEKPSAVSTEERELRPKVDVEGRDIDRDGPEKVQRREEWFMRPRVVPGVSSSDLLRQATEYKFKQRNIRIQMDKVRRQIAAATGSTTLPMASVIVGSPSTTWTPMGPRPIVRDTADTQNYGSLSGRVSAIAVDQADASGATVYVGGAFGGVWRSRNATATPASAVTWTPIIDDQATLAVGAIAVNGNTILIGTGEAKSAVDSYYGQGILRSTDGGSTWSLIQTADAGATRIAGLGFGHIVFSRDNPNIVVATTIGTGVSVGLGALTGNYPRGVFYSLDAGATWHTPAIVENGVTFQASAAGLLYNPIQHKFFVGIRYHGVYYSADGVTWTRTTAQPGAAVTLANCPSTFSGVVPNACPFWRGELAARTDKDEMYVWYANDSYASQGVYKTTNGGTTWTKMTTSSADTCDDSGTCASYQLFYNMTMAAVPNKSDADPGATDLYIGSGNIFKCTVNSTNPTCSSASEPYRFMDITHVYRTACYGVAKVHPDQHAIAYSTASPGVVYFGNDGGIYRTLNGPALNTQSCIGVSLPFDNLNDNIGSLTQFVWATPDPTDKTGVIGGAQDNGTSATGATLATNHGLTGQQFIEMASGDGGHTDIRSDTTPNIWYQSYTDAIIDVCTQGQNCGYLPFAQSSYIDNTASTSTGVDNLGGDSSAFYAPFMVDRQSKTHLIVGTCRVWRGSSTAPFNGNAISYNFNNFSLGSTAVCADTDSQGNTLSKISALAMGGPTTANGSQVIYAALDNGDMFMTLHADNGVSSWTRVTPPTTLNWGSSASGFAFSISSIVIDPVDTTGKTAYAAVQGFGANHVLMTTNGGVSWTGIGAPGANGLPDAPANTLALDPDDHTVLYVGTDVGVFVTSNGGATWTEVGPTQPGSTATGYLPNTVITHIEFSKPNGAKRLMAATYGRGIWTTGLNPRPFGSLDVAVDSVTTSTTVAWNHAVTVNGWAADTTDGAPVASVQILSDGNVVATATLGLSRPDVAAAYNNPAYTNSGWTATIPSGTLTSGVHSITAIASNSSGATTTLGPKSITVLANQPPFGSVEFAGNAVTRTSTIPQSATLAASGWAVDPEDGSPVTEVDVLVDNAQVGTATLGQPRPDVAAAYGNSAYTNSGWNFSYNVGRLSAGTHTFNFVAKDSGGVTALIGSRQLTISANQAPFGTVDFVGNAVTRTSSIPQYATLASSGWAVDQEDGSPVVQVQAFIDGVSAGTAVLGFTRNDVATAFSNPAFVNSGWLFNYNIGGLSTGVHTITYLAFDSAGASALIGSPKTFTVTANQSPIGSVDFTGNPVNRTSTVAQFATLAASGWAADPDDGAPVTQVQARIDGVIVGTATLGYTRSDVATAFNNPAYTNSGWLFNYNVGSLAPGTHTVVFLAYDSLAGSKIIGSKTITITANQAPVGSLDFVGNGADRSTTIPQYGGLAASGWVFDPEDGSPITQLQVLLDGKLIANATLGFTRADVAAAYGNPAYTNSGWLFNYNVGALAVGTHTVVFLAYDSVGGVTNLGSRSITIAPNPPFGVVDFVGNASNGTSVVPQNSVLSASGWAADMLYGSPITQVQVLIDGAAVGSATLGVARPDVAAAYGNSAYLNSGWTFGYNIGTLATGTHTVSVIGTNAAALQTTLGTRSITVQ